MTVNNDKYWWKTSTIYQIYPKSFCDSRGQGTGDICGIISKLDYLQTLGIDAIWLTPIYSSPMVDNGYDISDYYAINPMFGTMTDFDKLLEESHHRNIRVIMDIVVNHTSTQHVWFQTALKDKNSPYRDYYIWHDSVSDHEPNNWQSKFGGSAWEKEDIFGEYYLHLFAKEQADLNWENTIVRDEVKKIICFWAEKGVDGFRLDVINLISKDQRFPNDLDGDGRRFYTDGPRVHDYLQEISRDVFQRYGSVTVGEMSSTTLEQCQRYSACNGRELSMVFNFHHLKVDYFNGEKWTISPFDFIKLKRIFNYWQMGLNDQGWGALFWCNHDQPRIVSRFGDDQFYRETSAKMLAASLYMMQGTPYIYQGEEIGMTNPHFHNISQYRDVESLNMYDFMVNEQGRPEDEVLAILEQKSRDNSRTPMQWSSERYAGFSSVSPWIDITSNYTEINVDKAISSSDSVYYFYQQLIQLRKEIDVIVSGDYRDLYPEHVAIWGYQRSSDSQVVICLNNYRDVQVDCLLPDDLDLTSGRYLLGNYPEIQTWMVTKKQTLKPYETRIILIE